MYLQIHITHAINTFQHINVIFNINNDFKIDDKIMMTYIIQTTRYLLLLLKHDLLSVGYVHFVNAYVSVHLYSYIV